MTGRLSTHVAAHGLRYRRCCCCRWLQRCRQLRDDVTQLICDWQTSHRLATTKQCQFADLSRRLVIERIDWHFTSHLIMSETHARHEHSRIPTWPCDSLLLARIKAVLTCESNTRVLFLLTFHVTEFCQTWTDCQNYFTGVIQIKLNQFV